MLKKYKTYFLQAGLFIVTIITTTFAGMEWMGVNEELSWQSFAKGFLFSLPFLGILTVHEFGHYITARLYKVKVTLPYYIPFFIPFSGSFGIGTMGAFIRIKSILKTKREIFDIGVAGPIAGFIAALFILYYGFTHLPERESIYQVHEEYKAYGLDYDKHVYSYGFSKDMDSIRISQLKKSNPDYREQWPKKEYSTISLGKNLLMLFFEKYIANEQERIPNKYEMFHYPFIFAGFLALFFTALNLLPIGQLDGGHIIYGLFGAKGNKYISLPAFMALIYFSGIGVFKNNLIGNVFEGSISNFLLFSPLYFYFLYFILEKISSDKKNILMVAACIFAAQFFTEYLFPEYKGISLLYLIFGLLIGRFLGIYHPPAIHEEPLDLKRKIIGWISLIIFVICFTPDLFNVETFYP
jgi:membrane-associated protease RseP (regulator of RpoE activity)